MKQLFFLLYLLLNISCSCRKEQQTNIYFYNNSSKMIWVLCSFSYPDTLFINTIGGGYKVEPNTKKALSMKNGWDIEIERNNSYNYLILFTLDDSIAKIYSDEEISDSNLILKRYDLSIEQLKALNWTIAYP